MFYQPVIFPPLTAPKPRVPKEPKAPKEHKAPKVPKAPKEPKAPRKPRQPKAAAGGEKGKKGAKKPKRNPWSDTESEDGHLDDVTSGDAALAAKLAAQTDRGPRRAAGKWSSHALWNPLERENGTNKLPANAYSVIIQVSELNDWLY